MLHLNKKLLLLIVFQWGKVAKLFEETYLRLLFLILPFFFLLTGFGSLVIIKSDTISKFAPKHQFSILAEFRISRRIYESSRELAEWYGHKLLLPLMPLIFGG